MQYFNPKNYDLVYEALSKAGRFDLIGTSSKCLIKPKNGYQKNNQQAGGKNAKKGRQTLQRRNKKR